MGDRHRCTRRGSGRGRGDRRSRSRSEFLPRSPGASPMRRTGIHDPTLGDCAAPCKPGSKMLAGEQLKTPLNTIYTAASRRTATPASALTVLPTSPAPRRRAARRRPALSGHAVHGLRQNVRRRLAGPVRLCQERRGREPDAARQHHRLAAELALAAYAWNVAFLDAFRPPDPAKDASAWNRGAYIVEGLEHCGECHTPRGVAQNLDNAQKFSGAVLQGWKAYNITASKPSGVGGWSDDALASYLSTGHADGHSSASGPMAEAVDNSLSHATPDDIHAIVAYLRGIALIDKRARHRAKPARSERSPSASRPRRPSLRRQLRQLPRLVRKRRTMALRRLARQPHRQRPRRHQSDGDPARRLERPAAGRARLPCRPSRAATATTSLAAVANFVNGFFGNGTTKVAAADIGWAAQGAAVVDHAAHGHSCPPGR